MWNDDIQQAFFAYVQRTNNGTARAVYRTVGADKITTLGAFTQTMIWFVCFYLNQCYQSLLTEDDPVVVSDYAPFKNQSPVCLFNLMYQFTTLVLKNFIFELLNWDSLEMFSASFMKQWCLISRIHEAVIVPQFMHVCTGLKKEDCEIGKPLFAIKEEIDDLTDTDLAWTCFLNGCLAMAKYHCNGCKSAHYCGKAHQKAHWKHHKAICKNKQQEQASANLKANK